MQLETFPGALTPEVDIWVLFDWQEGAMEGLLSWQPCLAYPHLPPWGRLPQISFLFEGLPGAVFKNESSEARLPGLGSATCELCVLGHVT